jgi:hypothetical protein
MNQFRVVWRWRTDPYSDEFSDERERIYKTEAGARRLLDKLNRDGGKYTFHREVEPTRYDDGFRTEEWCLDYARLEVREVGPWVTA